MMRKIFLLAFLSVFLSYSLFGEEILGRIKNENLLIPRKILLSRENIFILDMGNESIKIFTAEGTFLKKFGRKGQGPGEFVNAVDFCLSNGKIYVLDPEVSKLEIFSEKGERLDSKRINISNSFSIAVNGGNIYISTVSFLKGQKIIHILDNKFSPKKSFLDCFPLEGMNLDSIYKNFGCLAVSDDRVYFAFTLTNKLLEFSSSGELLKEYLLPLKSIEKPEIERKNAQMLLKKGLNYDIKAKGEKVYLLSRDEKGNSIIFELEKGNLKERFKLKEKLMSFDITQERIYGMEEEEGNVIIYRIKK